MQKLTSSIYTFEELIKGKYLYVDKTEFIWELVSPYKESYFLSRPRRFGKSLTVSTLKAVFQGRKDLFEGLAIFDKPYDWKKYPVIHIDLANCDAQTPLALRRYLARILTGLASMHKVSVDIHEDELAASFESLLRAVAQDSPLVILLDEYDKPILNTLAMPEAKACRDILKGFYSTIKKCESLERFVFVTGVSKFAHVSIFSDLNNLTDITMRDDYATMLGYTQAEFEKYFARHIEAAVERLGSSSERLLAEIKRWYDGYRFEENAESVYNPVSLAQFFINNHKFNNYWFSTGTPTFLMDLVQKTNFDFASVLSNPVSAVAFDSFEIDDLDPLPLLLQTGYLTIKSSERRFNTTWYRLDFPNQEVSASFNTWLLNAYAGKTRSEVSNFCQQLAAAMTDSDIELLRKALESFFAGIPYDLHHKSESNFQNIFYVLFRLLGYYISAESRTSDGRIDAVTQTDKWVYLFEFKLDKDESALAQIKQKEYFKPYLLSPKRVMLIGVNFDSKTGRLSNWKNEEVGK
jgi:hypothetical protein